MNRARGAKCVLGNARGVGWKLAVGERPLALRLELGSGESEAELQRRSSRVHKPAYRRPARSSRRAQPKYEAVAGIIMIDLAKRILFRALACSPPTCRVRSSL